MLVSTCVIFLKLVLLPETSPCISDLDTVTQMSFLSQSNEKYLWRDACLRTARAGRQEKAEATSAWVSTRCGSVHAVHLTDAGNKTVMAPPSFFSCFITVDSSSQHPWTEASNANIDFSKQSYHCKFSLSCWSLLTLICPIYWKITVWYTQSSCWLMLLPSEISLSSVSSWQIVFLCAWLLQNMLHYFWK